MKKLSILLIACALAAGAAGCKSKKSSTAPANTDTTEPAGGGDMGGDAYGGDPYGGGEGEPDAMD
jgi:hypothetical protein